MSPESGNARIPIWLISITLSAVISAAFGMSCTAMKWSLDQADQVKHNKWDIEALQKALVASQSDHDLLQRVNNNVESLTRGFNDFVVRTELRDKK